MQTMTRPVETTPPVITHRRSYVWPIVVVVALLLGLVGGWFIKAAMEDDPTTVVVGGGGLTARQEEMVDVAEEYLLAWQEGETADALALMTATAVMKTDADDPLRVDDGSLEAAIDGSAWTTLDLFDPMLIDGNTITQVGVYGGVRFTNVLEFTATGDVLIAEHTTTAIR